MTAPFIVFEGLDGSGKTTISRRLYHELLATGAAVEWTNEPDGTHVVGGLIRGILRAETVLPATSLHPAIMALLFSADRLEHAARVILPQRDAGVTVLCDRYLLSTVVYQAVAFERETKRSAWRYTSWIVELQKHAPTPDRVVVLDITPEEAIKRRRGRGLPDDYYERDALTDVVRRAELYREAECYLPDAIADRVVHVDAHGSEDEVYVRVREAVADVAPH